MITAELQTRMHALLTDGTPFVLATVVRVRRPSSVRPGDCAIVLRDGTTEGFVGGICAESSVRLHALRALETGEPLLLRLVPAAGSEAGAAGGAGAEGGAGAGGGVGDAVVEHNPCLSGGALEIFLEPRLPAARVVVLGGSPIAEAVEAVARAAGYRCEREPVGAGAAADGAGAAGGPTAVIVASHGNAEEDALTAALRAGVPYVALVASRRRGAAVRAALEVPDELREQLHTPAGLDIGARTPAEIAIAILAELIAVTRADAVPERAGTEEAAADTVAVATDPVCGMQVAAVASTPRIGDVYFCSDRCRDAYATEHAAR